jgi:hypothetical protein
VTGSDPGVRSGTKPDGPSSDVSRPPFGFRGVVLLTAVVCVLAVILVFVLYLSPLAAR